MPAAARIRCTEPALVIRCIGGIFKTQTRKAGDRGALVALLQLALERAGQMPGALDGIFGAQTAAAVRAFQAANALVPDGIAGAQTHRALLPYYTGFVLRTVRAGSRNSAPFCGI